MKNIPACGWRSDPYSARNGQGSRDRRVHSHAGAALKEACPLNGGDVQLRESQVSGHDVQTMTA